MRNATYKQLQAYVATQYGFTPETCWIAHVMESLGVPLRKAQNRADPRKRVKPCPADKRPPIEAALHHFDIV